MGRGERDGGKEDAERPQKDLRVAPTEASL
jgi:hypothetical protein